MGVSRNHWVLGAWLSSALALCSCGLDAPTRSKSVELSCVLPADQGASTPYRWAGGPIEVQLDASLSGAASSFQTAVAAWNKHYMTTKGVNAFKLLAPSQTSDPLLSVCDSPSSVIKVFGLGNWGSRGSGTVAITTTCPSDGIIPQCERVLENGVRRRELRNGMIEINLQDFYASGKPAPNLVTVFMHELGHLLGMKHSCESNPSCPGVANCGTKNPDYLQAILFPSVDAGRTSLNRNDQGRANCIAPGLPEG